MSSSSSRRPYAYAIAERYRAIVILLSATLISSYGILIQASEDENGVIPYSSTSVNFLIETSKAFICLIACVVFDRRRRRRGRRHRAISGHSDDDDEARTEHDNHDDDNHDDEYDDKNDDDNEGDGPLTTRERLLFAVPALLYAIDNNLTYVILQHLDAATVAVVWNLKILTTALLYRYLLRRRIRNLQWIAIWLLLFGIVTTQSHRLRRGDPPVCEEGVAVDYDEATMTMTMTDDRESDVEDAEAANDAANDNDNDRSYLVGMVLILVAVTLSSMAGICCEYIFKRRPRMSYVHQNAYFCAYGMLFNGITLLAESTGDYDDDDSHSHSPRWFEGYSSINLLLVANSTATGLLVGFMFKALDNIAVVFAHAESMILTALFSVVVFGFSLGVEFACGVGVSVVALYLYDVDPRVFLVEESASIASEAYAGLARDEPGDGVGRSSPTGGAGEE